MSIFDIIIPHRLLCNMALNQKGDHIRRDIADYVSRREQCIAEIKSVESKNNAEFCATKDMFISDINNTVIGLTDIYSEISVNVVQFVFQLQTFITKYRNELDYWNNYRDILDEDLYFYKTCKKQLAEYLKDIDDVLKMLYKKTDIKQILCVIELSNPNFPVEKVKNYWDFDRVIDQLIEEYTYEDSEYNALMRLKKYIENEYKPYQKYIRKIKAVKEDINLFIIQVNDKIQSTISEIEITNKKINKTKMAFSGMARHLTGSAENCVTPIMRKVVENELILRNLYDERNSYRDEYDQKINRFIQKKNNIKYIQKSISLEIKDMINNHSRDTARWTDLQNRKTECNDEWKTCNDKIVLLNSEKHQKLNNLYDKINLRKQDIKFYKDLYFSVTDKLRKYARQHHLNLCINEYYKTQLHILDDMECSINSKTVDAYRTVLTRKMIEKETKKYA